MQVQINCDFTGRPVDLRDEPSGCLRLPNFCIANSHSFTLLDCPGPGMHNISTVAGRSTFSFMKYGRQ